MIPGQMLPYLLGIFLFFIGIYAVVAKKNLVKIIVGTMIADYAVNYFLLTLGYRKGGIAPILTRQLKPAEFIAQSVDPLPQALILTSIVIGLGMTALMIALAVRLYDRYGTFDVTKIRKLKG